MIATRYRLHRYDPRVVAVLEAMHGLDIEKQSEGMLWKDVVLIIDIVLNVDHKLRERKADDSSPWAVRF